MTYTEAPVALPTPRGREDPKAEEAEHPPRPQHGYREGQQEPELRHRERPPPAATAATAAAATTAAAIAPPEGALEAANDKSDIDGMSEF